MTKYFAGCVLALIFASSVTFYIAHEPMTCSHENETCPAGSV